MCCAGSGADRWSVRARDDERHDEKKSVDVLLLLLNVGRQRSRDGISIVIKSNACKTGRQGKREHAV